MKVSLLIFILIFIAKPIYSQNVSQIVSEKTGNISFSPLPITGLWVVEQVIVGEQDLSPTAQWILFEEEGTFISGNGWLQNGLGSWVYDEQQKTLLQSTEIRIDPYGPFNVSFQDQKMVWDRVEEGNKVRIILVAAKNKPMAPWDKIIGTWEIEIANGINPTNDRVISEYSLEKTIYIFDWDRRYKKFDKEGNLIEKGVWQIEVYSPILLLISDEKDIRTIWQIEFNSSQMVWARKLNEELMKLYFKRK